MEKLFIEQLQELNPKIPFEACDYNRRTVLYSIIYYRSADTSSIKLPRGAVWREKNNILYRDHMFHMVPRI